MKRATSYSFTNYFSEFLITVSQVSISHGLVQLKISSYKTPDKAKNTAIPLTYTTFLNLYIQTPDIVFTAKMHSKLFWYRNLVSHFTATRLLLGVFSRTYYLTAKALSMISSFLIVRYTYSVTCTPTPILILSIFSHSNYSNVKFIFHLTLEIYMLVKLVSI